MRTTVRLDKALMEQARREAKRRGVTLTSLIETGLRLVLAQSRPKVSLLAGVDLNSGVSLLDVTEARR
jgi:hypothetical protein